MGKMPRKPGRKRAGSRILIEIVALVVIIFIAMGSVSYLFFRNSQNRLIQKSKDKLVENRGSQMCSTNDYVVTLQTQISLMSSPGATPQSMAEDMATGLVQKEVSGSQEIVNDMLRALVSSGFYNAKLAFYASPPYAGVISKPTIIMSSDSDTIYDEVPAVLVDLVKMNRNENRFGRQRYDANNAYMFFENGIPGLGLKGEYLVSSYRFRFQETGNEAWFFEFSSMGDELASVDTFYKTERQKIDNAMALFMAGALAILIIITFFILGYLIRKKITGPIDELENAAEKVMEGDLDVQVPTKPGEEFYGLKTAFNNMMLSLRDIMNRSLGTGKEDSRAPQAAAVEEKSEGRKKSRRSTVLLPLTAIIIIVFIFSGAVIVLGFQQSLAKLVEKSKEQIVRSEAQGIAYGNQYIGGLGIRYYLLSYPDMLSPENLTVVLNSLKNKEVNKLQVFIADDIKNLIENGFCGLDVIFYVTPPIPGISENPVIYCGNANELVNQELSEELIELKEIGAEEKTAYRERINETSSYMLAEDGFPYLGLKGEYLVVTFHDASNQSMFFNFWAFDFKPMGEQLAEMDEFYSRETGATVLLIIIVVVISVILVSLITLIVLNYLLKSRITRPVDELAAIAEEVMEGNLDVQILITKGEEFESLKRAFHEMLKTLNDLLGKSSL